MKPFLAISLVILGLAMLTSTQAALPLPFFNSIRVRMIKDTLANIGNILYGFVPKFLKPSFWKNVDPDIYLTPSLNVISVHTLTYQKLAMMISRKGYPIEVHTIITEDGYMLTAWRMRKNVTRKYPVVLQHGLLDCSFSWVINEVHQSLPYLLVDAGYDVWLTNNRGNRYSRGHTKGDSYKEYWAFSWDEMAKFDLPACNTYIRNVTGLPRVHYIGHSQGTTQWFAHMTVNVSMQTSYHSFVGLGPVLYVSNVTGLFSHTYIEKALVYILGMFNIKQFLVLPEEDIPILGDVCSYAEILCESVIKMMCGFTKNQNYNISRMAVMASHEPGGTSLQTISHWLQMVGSTQFSAYDHGKKKNLEKYGSPKAPAYAVENLEHLEIPIFLVQGTADLLSDEQDYQTLINHLPNSYVKHIVVEDWGHLDYLWAYDANKKVYYQILEFLEKAELK